MGFRKRFSKRRRKQRAKWRQQKLAVGTVQRIATTIAKREALKSVVRKVFNPFSGTHTAIPYTTGNALLPYVPHGQPFNSRQPGNAEEKNPGPLMLTSDGKLYALDGIPRHLHNSITNVPSTAKLEWTYRETDACKSTSVTVWGVVRGGDQLIGRNAFVYNNGNYPAVVSFSAAKAETYVTLMLVSAVKGTALAYSDIPHWYQLRKENQILSSKYHVLAEKTMKIGAGESKRFKMVYTKDRILRWLSTTNTGNPEYSRAMYLYMVTDSNATANSLEPKPSIFWECRNNFIDIGKFD